MSEAKGPTNKAIGEAHRAKLRRCVVRHLCIGSRIPTEATLGRLLGIDPSQATRHRQRTFREDGIIVKRVEKRLYVVAIHPQVPHPSTRNSACCSGEATLSGVNTSADTAGVVRD